MDSIFELPLPPYKDGSFKNFEEYLFYLFDKYFKNVKEFLLENEDIPVEINHINDSIKVFKDIYRLYISGHRNKAYLKLSEILNKNIEHIKICVEAKKNHKNYPNNNDRFKKQRYMIEIICQNFTTLSNLNNTLYRLRPENDPNQIKSNKDLFHIPFQLSHIISSQRYSVLGFPMLYLGSSTEICNLELNCIKDKDIYVSYFKIKEGFLYLDLTKDINTIFEDYKHQLKKIKPLLEKVHPELSKINLWKKNFIDGFKSLLNKGYSFDNEILKVNVNPICSKENNIYIKYCEKIKKEIEIFKKFIVWIEIIDNPMDLEILLKKFSNKEINIKELKKVLFFIISQLNVIYDSFNIVAKLEKRIVGTFLIYPLFIATNIKVNDYKKQFKHEYIYSQMLMEWLRNTDEIDGVMYISTKSKNEMKREQKINLVVSPKTYKTEGICEEIFNKFEISEPKIYRNRES